MKHSLLQIVTFLISFDQTTPNKTNKRHQQNALGLLRDNLIPNFSLVEQKDTS